MSLQRKKALADSDISNNVFVDHELVFLNEAPRDQAARGAPVAANPTPDGLEAPGQAEAEAPSASDPSAANGTLRQMADYQNYGYWSWADYQGTNPRHWAALNSPPTTVTYNIEDLLPIERSMAEEALSLYAGISANITFQRVTSGGQIVFNNNAPNAFTAQTVSGNSLTSATVSISDTFAPGDFGTYMYQTYLHEIGHALGLGHQGPYNTTADYGVDNIYDNDSWRLAVMSYFNQDQAHQGSWAYVTTPQMADILAIHSFYGVGSVRTGNSVYGFNNNTGISYSFATLGSNVSFTIYDSGGTDTFDTSGFSNRQTIDLRPGQFSSVGGETNNIGIWLDSVIENAIGGSGEDTFIGNTANNRFTGNGGQDVVIFNGTRNQFTFTETNNYGVTGNGQGTDTLNSIEVFLFDDVIVLDDAIGGTSTTDAIGLNQSVSGTIQFYGDRDWYRVTLTAGQNYVFDLRGLVTNGGTLGDPYLRLYNSAGTLIAQNDNDGVGFDSQLAVRANTTGTYYLSASQFNDTGLGGTYRLETEALGSVSTRYQAPTLELNSFGPSANAGGWSSQDQYPRMIGDFNGDRVTDIIGFGGARVYVALGSNGSLLNPVGSIQSFGSDPAAGGWLSQNYYTRTVGDVNGDGKTDIIGFGSSWTYVALATTNGQFANPILAINSFGADSSAGGWSNDTLYHREAADVNGDQYDDVVGFGSAGTYVALGRANGTFANPFLAIDSFGTAPGAGGWNNQNVYYRELADVNGDGRADIVGFGATSVYVALGQANGTFANPIIALNSFGSSGGWGTQDQFPRHLADVNIDGRADIVGFGSGGVYIAYGSANGTFAAPFFDIASFGSDVSAGGWSSNNVYPRLLGDLTGDGRPEILGLGSDGVFVSRDFDFVNV